MAEQLGRLTKTVQGFLNPQPISDVVGELPNMHVGFLLSFPRSGNGFVRYVLAKIMLAANGYDLGNLQQDVYDHTGRGGHAQRFIFPSNGKKISIEDVVPDFHMNDAKWIENVSKAFFFGGGPLVKTHSVIGDRVADYIYLYRAPEECSVSYFNLVADEALVARVISGEDREVFLKAVATYLAVYTEMGQRALKHVETGQCSLLSLARIENGELNQFCTWIRKKVPNASRMEIESVTNANRKLSGYNKALMDCIGPELDEPLAQAKAVQNALERHGDWADAVVP